MGQVPSPCLPTRFRRKRKNATPFTSSFIGATPPPSDGSIAPCKRKIQNPMSPMPPPESNNQATCRATFLRGKTLTARFSAVAMFIILTPVGTMFPSSQTGILRRQPQLADNSATRKGNIDHTQKRNDDYTTRGASPSCQTKEPHRGLSLSDCHAAHGSSIVSLHLAVSSFAADFASRFATLVTRSLLSRQAAWGSF